MDTVGLEGLGAAAAAAAGDAEGTRSKPWMRSICICFHVVEPHSEEGSGVWYTTIFIRAGEERLDALG
jgi:hypothetical protein